MNLNLQIPLGVCRAGQFPGEEHCFMASAQQTALGQGAGGRGSRPQQQTHRANAVDVALRRVAVAFAGLANSSEEYSVHAVIAGEAGLQKKHRRPER